MGEAAPRDARGTVWPRDADGVLRRIDRPLGSARCAPTSQKSPTATYHCEDSLDNDGIVDKPLRISRRCETRARRLDISTSPARRQQHTGRSTFGVTRRSRVCYVALEAHLPRRADQRRHVPADDSPIPEGSVLAAQYPSPSAAISKSVSRVLDVCSVRWRRRSPQVPAAPFGTIGVVTVGGAHPDLRPVFRRGVPVSGRLWRQPRRRWPGQRRAADLDGQLRGPGGVRAPLSADVRVFRAA